MKAHLKVALLSCVGGGPMARLVSQLNSRGQAADLKTEMSALEWRKLAAAGQFGRVRARLKAMVQFPVRSVLGAITSSAFSSKSSAESQQPRDVLVPTTNPFFVPALLVATKALHGRPVVPLIYDLYPDAAEVSGHARLSPLAVRLGQALNRFLFAHADGVVFIGDRMAGHAIGRYGKPRTHVVLHTGAALSEFSSLLDESGNADELGEVCGVDVRGKRVLSYVGNMGHVHDWTTLRDGLLQLIRAEPKNVAVIISASGPGVELLKKELPAEREGLVHFVSPTDDAEWRRLMARTDIALVTLRDGAKHTSVPSKTFSAMAAGSAIIAIAPRGSDLADVVLSSDCGVLVAPGNGLHVLDAIQRLVRDDDELARLRANAMQAVARHYDIDRLAEGWETFLEDVASRPQAGFGYATSKRVFDMCVAAVALAGLSPLLLGSAVAVRLSVGAPVLFRQRRPGHDGVPFELLKFRSMREPRPNETGPEHDAARLTRVGKIIRATSIDELPALLNVLRGDMSLVGPRPLLMRYLSRYSKRQQRRHDVVPGITGQAQVSGRNSISWDEKFEHDVWYVENRSLVLDLKILAKTVLKVVRRSDISSTDHATMPEFMGASSQAQN